MKFCTHVHLDNLYNPIEFQGHRSKVLGTWVFFYSVCVMQGLMILFYLILLYMHERPWLVNNFQESQIKRSKNFQIISLMTYEWYD